MSVSTSTGSKHASALLVVADLHALYMRRWGDFPLCEHAQNVWIMAIIPHVGIIWKLTHWTLKCASLAFGVDFPPYSHQAFTHSNSDILLSTQIKQYPVKCEKYNFILFVIMLKDTCTLPEPVITWLRNVYNFFITKYHWNHLSYDRPFVQDLKS